MLDLLPIKNKVCVEVGVWKGQFSAEILSRGPKKLYLVDPWAHEPGYRDRTNPGPAVFEAIFQRVAATFAKDKRVCIKRLPSFNAAQTFEHRSLDFVYIDANHTLNRCAEDICLWWPKLRIGGWLCGHDLCGMRPGVVKAVNEFFKTNWPYNDDLPLRTQSLWKSWGVKKCKANSNLKG